MRLANQKFVEEQVSLARQRDAFSPGMDITSISQLSVEVNNEPEEVKTKERRPIGPEDFVAH